MRTAAGSFALVLCLALSPLAHADVGPPEVGDFSLPNGLRVLVVQRPASPSVAVEVFYHAGSKDEPEGRRGIAHLFEHMMFKGTARVPAEAHARYINQLGGQNNAYTTDDLTAYVESVPPAALDFALQLEADRMRGLLLSQQLLDSEREVVKEELRMRFENNPVMQGVQRMMSLAYVKHPYRTMAIGSKETLDQVTVEDCRRFYDTYYQPNNATVVLVGPVTEKDARALVEKHFLGLARGPAIVRQHVEEPPQTEARRATLELQMALPVVLGAYHVPGAAHADLYPLAVLQKILSDGDSSRLHRRIVRGGLGVYAGGFLFGFEDPGLFLTFAQLAPGGDLKKAQAAFDDELLRVTRTQVSAAELRKAKNQLATQALLERERSMGLADAVGQAALMKGDPRAPFSDLARYDAVTAAQVLAVAKKYLTPTNQTALAVRPRDKSAPAPAPAVEPPPIARAAPQTTVAPNPSTLPRLVPPANLPAPRISLDEVRREALPNGMKLLIVPRHELPLVHVRLVLQAGNLFAPLDKMGLAELTAETLRKGTTTQSAEALAEQIDGAGASLHVHVDDEVVSLSCSARSADLALCLDRLADLAQRPTLPAKEIEETRTEQLAQQIHDPRDDPGALARLHAPAAYFGDEDPRGRVVSERSLRSITRADLLAFHKTRYRPDQAMLVVSGDVKPEQLRGLLTRKRALGTWTSQGALPVVSRALPAARPLRVRLVDKPDATQTAFMLLGPGIARSAPDLFATQFSNYILGGGDFSSRLMKVVRSEGGKVYGIRSAFDTGRDPGTFAVATATRVSESGRVLKLIQDEIAKLRASGPTAVELEETRGNQLGGFARSLETASDLAGALAGATQDGLPDDFIEKSPARMAAVTLEELKRAAAAHFTVEVLVAVGPAAQIGPMLTALGLKIAETVPYDVAVNAPDRVEASQPAGR